MVNFITCRNGKGPIEKRLKDAVALFYKRRGKLPDLIGVHADELDAAQLAAAALDLPDVVRRWGGVLVGELWPGEREKAGGIAEEA
jgi:hypothetical protein